MPPADFAAAQSRLAARRRQRETANQARQRESLAARDKALQRLPFPFRNVGQASYTIWNTISKREGTRPAFRVGQVDAELLDEELLDLLKGQVAEALKYYGAQLNVEYSSEILLALRAILFKLTLWDHDASYGAALQGLRYTDARTTNLARPPPTRGQKSLYGITTVFGRYGWEKWQQYLSDLDGGFEEPSPQIRLLSRFTSMLDTTHSIASLVSFLTFLYNGAYRTLLDRILRLRLVPKSSHTSREVSFEYLNRQLVWHAFTEFLLFLLPLVGISRWRRLIGRAWRKTKSLVLGRGRASDEGDEALNHGELGFLPDRTCAICYADQNPASGAGEAEVMAASTGGGGVIGSAQTDITNPYEAMPCGDVYCFVCLAQKIESEEGEGWTCLRCGEVVKECRPWDGDVMEVAPSQQLLAQGDTNVSNPAISTIPADGEVEGEQAELSMLDVEPKPFEDEWKAGDRADVVEEAQTTQQPDQSAEWARHSTLLDDHSDSQDSGDDRSDAHSGDEYSDRSYNVEHSDEEFEEDEESLDMR